MQFQFGNEIGQQERNLILRFLGRFPDNLLMKVWRPERERWTFWMQRGQVLELITYRGEDLDMDQIAGMVRRCLRAMEEELEGPLSLRLVKENEKPFGREDFLKMRLGDYQRMYEASKVNVEEAFEREVIDGLVAEGVI